MIRFLWAKNASTSDTHSQIGEVYGDINSNKQTTCSEMVSLFSIRLTGCRKLQKGRERLVKFFNESYSSHSPDLAPSDYFLFPKLKEHFSGRWFSSDSAAKTSAETWLNGYGPDFYQDGLKKLVLHSDKCLKKTW
ncbi:uncharacterized protein TNCV_1694331 [Trichonephila clavipes]|nr:uncharacterized protein TNCV_1694331 [Trichonephila clavipes]